ncbi:hypothetical protein M2322_004391 [Rhodoblastus acidophilus]|uniref:hypothetical protein n=1 Tax=Rhodoblastus acidophilus TaxID=1074 RepID=UPI002224CA48|nr:hypothetical protein [Rhodoblastus acidophilus]MCW2318822.1 hypothetical protein [Rhodoblastus acidophilus]
MPRFKSLVLVSVALTTIPALAKPILHRNEPEILVVPDVDVDGAALDETAYARLRKAVEAFAENHALAPAATPKFLIASVGVKPSTALQLKMETRDRSIDVMIDKNGLFSLPPLENAEIETARLVLNQPRNAQKWAPFVRSPDMPKNHLRFGDLRMECEMRWAFVKETFDFANRTLLQSIGGPCHSAMVRVHYESPRPLAAVALVQGERRETLDARLISGDGRIFFPPISDTQWDDDALLELQFK